MKKLLIFMIFLITACCNSVVLNKNEYTIVDTLNVNKSGFQMILSYDVIIKYDSSYYYGHITTDSELIRMNPRKIKLK